MSKPDPEWEKELSETPLGLSGFSEKTMRQIKERVHMPKGRKGRLKPLVASLAATGLLVSGWLLQDPIVDWFQGVHKQERQQTIAWDKEKAVELSVQYWDKSSFMQSFGLPFTIRHPAVKFTVPTFSEAYTLDKYQKWLEVNKPDVLQVPLALIDDLADAGILKRLDDWIARDGYKLDELYEPVIATIREAGAGSIYGLAPNFDTDAVYYNKSMFAQAGLDSPASAMSWSEIMQLAARFSGNSADGKPIYGLTTDKSLSPFQLIADIGESGKLRLLDPGTLQPTLDSEAWLAVWEEVTRGYREGWISNESRFTSNKSFTLKDVYKADPFLTGRAALAVKSSSYMADITRAGELIGFKDDWGVLPQPIDPGSPNQAAQFNIGSVYAINAKSPHADTAWELLQYMNGPEPIKQAERLGTLGEAHSRLPAAGSGNEAFYQLGVDSSAIVERYELRTDSSYAKLIDGLIKAGDAQAAAVIAGSQTAEQAMKALQVQAEALAQAALSERAAGNEGS